MGDGGPVVTAVDRGRHGSTNALTALPKSVGERVDYDEHPVKASIPRFSRKISMNSKGRGGRLVEWVGPGGDGDAPTGRTGYMHP